MIDWVNELQVIQRKWKTIRKSANHSAVQQLETPSVQMQMSQSHILENQKKIRNCNATKNKRFASWNSICKLISSII